MKLFDMMSGDFLSVGADIPDPECHGDFNESLRNIICDGTCRRPITGALVGFRGRHYCVNCSERAHAAVPVSPVQGRGEC